MLEMLSAPTYDDCRIWISKAREKGWAWDEIRDVGNGEWLSKQAKEQFWPGMTEVEWKEIVCEKKRVTEEAIEAERIMDISADDTVLGKENDAEISVSSNEASNWMLYRRHLERQGWKESAVNSIEKKAVEILRRMKRMSEEPVKGLVVGHVQSGKTASMAGLMAIGADNLYNMFIVLSGTIENLRQQTQKRLFSDLNHPDCLHNCDWRSLERLGASSKMEDQAQNLDFSSRSSLRFMTVSLKNATRLNNLIAWLERNLSKLAQMRIVIIDDEADQASINTADVNGDERTRVNDLIVRLTQVKASSVNYVSYTATPYANFLNEAWPASLYPRDFIVTLPQSNEYFGPVQVFGLEGREGYEGLDIVREVPADEILEIGNIHLGAETKLPLSMQNALAWFLCACAARRIWKIKQPSSMLIHTSRGVVDHENMASAVKTWLEQPLVNIIEACRSVWQEETARFTLDDFRWQFSQYGCSEDIIDYPAFGDLLYEIEVLTGSVTNIPIDGNNEPVYHKGIHICIDNSANNGINDEMQMTRLIYPSISMDYTAAFIVIGGNTLARGLTIEGLVSNYFLRNSAQADSLMQMGRWFGYRRGYELLPRIWMTEGCRDRFEYMSVVEQELREELHGYMEPPYLNPSLVAPRIRNSPSLNWLRVTARNRMQHAQPVEFDFSGTNAQTTLFYRSNEILRHNIEVTESFLEGLPIASKAGYALVWKSVGFDQVNNFLMQFKFHSRSRLFGQIEVFSKWFTESQKEADYTDWNVVAGGIQSLELGSWELGGASVSKIRRTRLIRKTTDDSVAIGVLRAPQDLLADVTGFTQGSAENLDNESIVRLRSEAGLAKTPQLLLYRVSKDSRPEAGSLKRADLDVPSDLIGVSLWIPGVRDDSGNPNHVRMISVRLPRIAMDEELDIQ